MLNTSHELFQLHSNYQTFWGPYFQKFVFKCVIGVGVMILGYWVSCSYHPPTRRSIVACNHFPHINVAHIAPPLLPQASSSCMDSSYPKFNDK